ncbi:efflux RND transporter periplasmic adaptor subunit [Maricaulis sp. CAU 1757]
MRYSLKAILGIWLLSIFLSGCLPGDEDASDNAAAPQHAEADAHDDGDEGHDEHAETASLRLTPAQINELGISVEPVDLGIVAGMIELPGEVGFNRDRLAHVTPRVSGVVRSVEVTEGDFVQAGDLLAVLDSRELANTIADYLAARTRLNLAQRSFDREARLWERQISAEQDFLGAQQALEEARILVHTISQQLNALGISQRQLANLGTPTDRPLTQYEVTAPISGTIIERHAVLGEVVEEGSQPPAFIIADTRSVWIDAAVYGADLGRLRAGAAVSIAPSDSGPPIASTIAFISPQLGERTRTGRARIIVDGIGDRLRPGTFVTVEATVADAQPVLRVPVSALQTIDGEPVVFVRTAEGFEVRSVSIGERTDTSAEILSGLQRGEPIAVSGTFTLKAELQKEEFDDGHAH